MVDRKGDAFEWKHLAAGMTNGHVLIVATNEELVIATRKNSIKAGFSLLKIPISVLHQAGLRIADANLQVELLEAQEDMERMDDSIQEDARLISALRTRIIELEKELRDVREEKARDSPGPTGRVGDPG